MKISDDNIGDRTRYLPACSAVPQQTSPPRVPPNIYIYINLFQNIFENASVHSESSYHLQGNVITTVGITKNFIICDVHSKSWN
jgi:hypothetical protein